MTEDISLRWVVVSDGHWGRDEDGDDLDYVEEHNKALNQIDDLHAEREIDFLVYNGDIVHQDMSLHDEVISNFFDELPTGVDWHVVHGNHDDTTEEEWEDIYGVPFQQTFEHGDYGFVITDSAAEKNDEMNYYPADSEFVESSIDSFEDKEGVFVFQHIAPFENTDSYGVDSPDVREQFARPEVKGVFLAHNHNKNFMEMNDGGRYFYVCHIAGKPDLASADYDPVDDTGLRVFDVKDDGQ